MNRVNFTTSDGRNSFTSLDPDFSTLKGRSDDVTGVIKKKQRNDIEKIGIQKEPGIWSLNLPLLLVLFVAGHIAKKGG